MVTDLFTLIQSQQGCFRILACQQLENTKERHLLNGNVSHLMLIGERINPYFQSDFG